MLSVNRRICKPESFSGLGTAGTTGSLLGGGFADGADQEWLNPNARIVNLLLTESRIYDKDHTIDSQGCFRDVCWNDKFSERKYETLLYFFLNSEYITYHDRSIITLFKKTHSLFLDALIFKHAFFQNILMNFEANFNVLYMYLKYV